MNIFKALQTKNRKVSSFQMKTEKYWFTSPPAIIFYKEIKKSISSYGKNKKILDAGAGRLAYKKLILKYAKSYTSSDFKKTHKDLDVVTDIENMDFKDGRFDVVFCSQVLEHVPHPWKAFAEINRVLKKSGVAIITVPHLAYLHNLPYDFYRYTKFGLRTLSQDAGFEVLEIKELGGFFCFLGYMRSTIIGPVYALPILGNLILGLNYLISRIEIFLDRFTGNGKYFPLNYLMIVRKSIK